MKNNKRFSVDMLINIIISVFAAAFIVLIAAICVTNNYYSHPMFTFKDVENISYESGKRIDYLTWDTLKTYRHDKNKELSEGKAIMYDFRIRDTTDIVRVVYKKDTKELISACLVSVEKNEYISPLNDPTVIINYAAYSGLFKQGDSIIRDDFSDQVVKRVVWTPYKNGIMCYEITADLVVRYPQDVKISTSAVFTHYGMFIGSAAADIPTELETARVFLEYTPKNGTIASGTSQIWEFESKAETDSAKSGAVAKIAAKQPVAVLPTASAEVHLNMDDLEQYVLTFAMVTPVDNNFKSSLTLKYTLSELMAINPEIFK